MENRNFFKDVYDDFFGIEKIKEENEKLKKELGITDDFPVIELNSDNENKKENVKSDFKTKEEKDVKMKEYFETIDKLYIKDK